MEHILRGYAQRRIVKLLPRNDCLKSQFRYSTSLNRRGHERDDDNFTPCEGHANRIYQVFRSRHVFAAFTAADRPVHLENQSTNQHFARHSRFYCTAKNLRKKMVRSCANVEIVMIFFILILIRIVIPLWNWNVFDLLLLVILEHWQLLICV